ncbi:hypothetical protein ACP275_10G098900 [Erythranthe tilingii]
MANIDALFGCWVSHHANFMGSRNRRSPENRSRFLKTILPVALAHTIIWQLPFERSARSLRWRTCGDGEGLHRGWIFSFFLFFIFLRFIWFGVEPSLLLVF